MLNNKPLRYSLTAICSAGAFAMVIILSFTGMLYLTNNLVAGVISAILAVLIEGEIYKQNIYSGMGMLLQLGSFIKRNNYVKTLRKLAEDDDRRNNCTLLADYYQLMIHLAELEHAKNLNKEQKADLKRTATAVAEMEDLFIRYMTNDFDYNDQAAVALVIGLFSSDYEMIKTQNEVQATIKKQKTLLWLSMPVTVIGGALAVLVTASQLSEALVLFGIAMTPVIMFAVVWPIAALASVGFMIMIYKTFVDMIHNHVIQKHWKSFKKLFSKEKSVPVKVMYAVGITLLTALACVATIATAGTWWSAAKAGFTLLPFLAKISNTLKTVIISIGMALLGAGIFVFDYVNSLESFKTLTAKLSRAHVPEDQLDNVEKMSPIKKLFTILGYNAKHTFNEWSKKPWGVKLNPFAWFNTIIDAIFRFVLFVGHCISIGVTSDRIGDLNAAIPATINTMQEVANDIGYLWETKDHHHKGHKLHHHDHQHSDLAGYFLNVLLFPTKLLSALWNSAFGDKTFKQYLRKELGLSKPVSIKPHEVSIEWKSYKKIEVPIIQKLESDEEFTDTETGDLYEESISEGSTSPEESEVRMSHSRYSFITQETARTLKETQGLQESYPTLRACG